MNLFTKELTSSPPMGVCERRHIPDLDGRPAALEIFLECQENRKGIAKLDSASYVNSKIYDGVTALSEELRAPTQSAHEIDPKLIARNRVTLGSPRRKILLTRDDGAGPAVRIVGAEREVGD
jgi:hypothetical protein